MAMLMTRGHDDGGDRMRMFVLLYQTYLQFPFAVVVVACRNRVLWIVADVADASGFCFYVWILFLFRHSHASHDFDVSCRHPKTNCKRISILAKIVLNRRPATADG